MTNCFFIVFSSVELTNVSHGSEELGCHHLPCPSRAACFCPLLPQCLWSTHAGTDAGTHARMHTDDIYTFLLLYLESKHYRIQSHPQTHSSTVILKQVFFFFFQRCCHVCRFAKIKDASLTYVVPTCFLLCVHSCESKSHKCSSLVIE